MNHKRLKKNDRSLMGVGLGTGVGAGLAIVFDHFSNPLFYPTAVGIGAGVGFALGGLMSSRAKKGGTTPDKPMKSRIWDREIDGA